MGEIALPDSPFKQTKEIIQEKETHFKAHGGEGDLLPYMGILDGLSGEYNANFPLDDDDVNVLFEAMRDKLIVIYEAENKALETLYACLRPSS